MHSRLSFASLGAGLLLLGEAAAASIRVPNAHRLQRRAGSGPDTEIVSTPALVPKVEYIAISNLTEIVLPKPVDGMIRLPAFRPKDLQFASDSQPTDENMAARGLPDRSGLFPLPVLKEVQSSDRTLAPYTSIGKVFTRDGHGEVVSTCTGTMVGSRLFLTASHCVEDRPDDWSLDFAPAYNANNPNLPPPFGKALRAEKCYGIDSFSDVGSGDVLEGYDYVVCLLSEPIGLTVGYLGSNTPDSKNPEGLNVYLGRTWFSAGYPKDILGGQVLIRAENITIRHVELVALAGTSIDNGKTFVTPPYPDHGWSGGPLYGVNPTSQDAEIIGIVSAFRHVRSTNDWFTSATHSGGPRLTKLIAWARCQWPGWTGECEGSQP